MMAWEDGGIPARSGSFLGTEGQSMVHQMKLQFLIIQSVQFRKVYYSTVLYIIVRLSYRVAISEVWVLDSV